MDRVAVASLIVATVGTVAAVFAAFYAKGSPTKADLQRVEDNTAEGAKQLAVVRERLDEERRMRELDTLAKRLRLTVKGRQSTPQGDLILAIGVISEIGVSLIEIEFVGRPGMRAGIIAVESNPDGSCSVRLPTAMANDWWQAGEMADHVSRKRLQMVVRVEFEEGITNISFVVTALQSFATGGYVLSVDGKS